jgi:RNA polymerase sigma-70 factor (ECF subfamily)
MKDEAALVDKALGGDESAFEELLHPYRQGMLNIAYQMTGNTEEARDICQTAMIKVFKHLKRFRPGKNLKNWLYKIVKNVASDFYRKKKRDEGLKEEHKKMGEEHKKMGVSAGYSPEKDFLNREIREKIEACLKYLSPREKMVFLLRDAEGFSIKETARVMGSSSQSVRTHLCRARRKLRLEFEKIYPKGRWSNEV